MESWLTDIRITGEWLLSPFCQIWRAEVKSDVARAAASYQMWREAEAVGWRWHPSTCSQKALAESLAATPHDGALRQRLCLTLFLSGDLERSATEALKLAVTRWDAVGESPEHSNAHRRFGVRALQSIEAFVGPDDPLMRQLGNWSQLVNPSPH